MYRPSWSNAGTCQKDRTFPIIQVGAVINFVEFEVLKLALLVKKTNDWIFPKTLPNIPVDHESSLKIY
jgi:hypothetical protein